MNANQFSQILPFVLLATGAGLLGGLVAIFWNPKVKARSAIQHFAAGAVFAVIASDVIPEVERIGTIPGILGGLAAGGLVMIGIKFFVVRFEREEKEKKQLPVGLAAAAAVDTFLDGAIISAGFHTGQQLGTILAVALAIELFFLTLSVGSEFQRGSKKGWMGVAVTSGIAALLFLSAFGTNFLMQGAPDTTVAVILAFGAAGLIYLIAEELLVESIEAEHSLFSTAMLFAGFLVLIALELINAARPAP